MGALATELRNQLSKACVAAREAAQKGAESALKGLAVHHHEPHGSMTPEQRALRNRLRAHGRQLGDTRDKQRGTQTIDRLIHECAYEHWHRMLFARFLAENHLLIEPNSGVAITMEECEELARDAGEDSWALASRFAQRMLPQIFRPDDPVLAVGLPPETRQALERLLAVLPAAVFTADDALGWTYQFWQSAEKDRVNASGEKITGATLPAVTQLFTEHYMVLFLLHNTIGAWHAGKVLAQRPELAENAASEQELRDAVALDDYQFEYLRFVRKPRDGDEEGEATGSWRPAAGTFDGWPREASELTVLDPCCGSGHFLVEVFFVLVRLRIAEEGLAREDAIRAVLKDNVFGLELDARCTQIAAFNLALAAWRMVGKVIDLPELNVACSGIGPQSTEQQWLKLAEQSGVPMPAVGREPIKNGLLNLHRLFSQAPELGSLIDPEALPGDLIAADYETLRPYLAEVFKAESDDDESRERIVAAESMARAAEILVGPSMGYSLAITNVPYLGRGAQSDTLKAFADEHHADAKADLATIFVSRIVQWLCPAGSAAMVTPQNWLFIGPYRRFRRTLLRRCSIPVVAQLGPHAFETISGEIVNVNLAVLNRGAPAEQHGVSMLNVSRSPDSAKKADALRTIVIHDVRQNHLLKGPDSRIAIRDGGEQTLLSEYADSYKGIATGDLSRFIHLFWEVGSVADGWRYYQGAVKESLSYGGREEVVFWEGGRGQLFEYVAARLGADGVGAWLRGDKAWGRDGVAVAQMRHLPCTLYRGDLFDENTAALIPKRPEYAPPIWAYCRSSSYLEEVRKIDNSSLKVPNLTLLKVPFDLSTWQREASSLYPEGLSAPYTDDPTQWIFHGNPATTVDAAVFHVGVARLIAYRWPAEGDVELALAAPARAWADRSKELYEYADDDGIVCIWPVRGEASAADRLRALLAAAFGNDWSASKERDLLQAAANEFNKGKAAKSLEDWLVDRFFEEHCKLFQHRPFVWHIWDGRADGFNALVNYHKLVGPDGEGLRTLKALTFSYLGDWIERQRADRDEDKEGADARLAAALDLQEQLKKILAGEPPYDIFVRWKPLHEQPIGWDPDINDGVRLNIRPFLSATLRTGAKKGAGILRAKPNIDWKKDRGKEPESLRPKADFPWFWSCDPEKKPEHRQDFQGGAKFDGNRWNDLHYTNAFKQAMREQAR